ncbi:Pkinase-domain-containing protein [Exidia glandulosa HHB12029]|uniref:non-specific serine/threonine protein kinase n=1 Tax=Exidia glandulosa HHB12029 TaxID=1314781 RepID=A0A165KLZ1_EXIGL|nr:Pkinase-domain-containing protein [Exidia glandulosa HHB12029]
MDVNRLVDAARDALSALSSCVCRQQAKIKINGRTYKLVKLLGEGGFSFVYLAEDEHSGRQFALKVIRCPTGTDGVQEAMREVEAHRRFKHPNIMRILDSAVVQDPQGDGKIVYLFLPYFKRGNLHDALSSHALHGTHFPEREMVNIFRGTCEAVKAMHQHRAKARKGGKRQEEQQEHEQEEQGLPEPEGDAEGGFSYHAPSSSSRARQMRSAPQAEVVFEADDEPAAEGEESELHPWAHRDIKPANVMLADDGTTPVLMDLGSAVPARVPIATRQEALMQQEMAAERSSMPYRAPELFDVKTDTTLDEKVDIWSLGATLYTLAYLYSPFEAQAAQGASIQMAVMNAQYKHPPSEYSRGLRQLIDKCLIVDPAQRPSIDEVIALTDGVLQNLS